MGGRGWTGWAVRLLVLALPLAGPGAALLLPVALAGCAPVAPPPPPPPRPSPPPPPLPPLPPPPPPVSKQEGMSGGGDRGPTAAMHGPTPAGAGSGRVWPEFPLPAPRPSARHVIPRELVLRRGATLGAVADRLGAAARAAGFEDAGLYRADGGFALVLHAERIDRNLVPLPEPQRWSTGPQPLVPSGAGFSLTAILDALLHADPGRFRLIVLVASDAPRLTGDTAMTAADAGRFAIGGAATLPREIRALPFTDQHNVTALIYEFVRPAVGRPAVLSDDRQPGSTHLRRSRILPALEGSR